MGIRIVKVSLSGGSGHEHIARVQWTDANTPLGRTNSREEIVSFIEHDNGTAYTQDEKGNRASVEVRRTASGTKYLQTRADGVWTNNLLALPKF